MKHTCSEYEGMALHQLDKSYKLNEPTAIGFTIQVAQVYATLALAAATEEPSVSFATPAGRP